MRTARYLLAASIAGLFAASPAAASVPLEVTTTEANADIQSGTHVIPAGSSAFKVDAEGNVFMGPNEMARDYVDNFNLYESTPFVPDFAYRADTRRIYSRSLVLAEQGDSPDIAIGRVGPDNAYPVAAPAGIPAGTRLGGIYFRGWMREGGFNNRVAEISSYASEALTERGAGGVLRLATTSIGTHSLTPRMVLDADGGIRVMEATTTPRAPGPGEGVVLYVQGGVLKMLDASGHPVTLAQPPVSTTTIERHETTTQVPAPSDAKLEAAQRKVTSLEKKVTSVTAQLKSLRTTVTRLARKHSRR